MWTYLYWLPCESRVSSVTGKEVVEERGPFVVCEQGSAWRKLSVEEIVCYVLKMHMQFPVRISIKKSGFRRGKGSEV
jgi:hypothetical protein